MVMKDWDYARIVNLLRRSAEHLDLLANDHEKDDVKDLNAYGLLRNLMEVDRDLKTIKGLLRAEHRSKLS
jgi:hypothetical protein